MTVNSGPRRRISQAQLEILVQAHERYVGGKPGGRRISLGFSDLSGLDLADRELSDGDFAGTSFDGARMPGVRLARANLFGCSFRRACRPGSGSHG